MAGAECFRKISLDCFEGGAFGAVCLLADPKGLKRQTGPTVFWWSRCVNYRPESHWFLPKQWLTFGQSLGEKQI